LILYLKTQKKLHDVHVQEKLNIVFCRFLEVIIFRFILLGYPVLQVIIGYQKKALQLMLKSIKALKLSNLIFYLFGMKGLKHF